MAHVFYADKHPTHHKDKSEDQWAHQMSYVFSFMEFWNKRKLYKAFNWIPLRLANGFGGIAGKIALKSSKKYKKKLQASYNYMFQGEKTITFKKFLKAYSSYLGKLMFAFMGGLTLKKNPPDTSFTRFENLSLLNRELSKGRGVIIPITHLGELTQAIWSVIKHPNKYTVATIVYVPHMGIYKYANHPYYSNVYFYASTSFNQISLHLENHLRKNHIVMIYYDFGRPGQFRVPFWWKKYPYLLYTPQSVIKLHRQTNASILPCINMPNELIGRTKLKFIENSHLMNLSNSLKGVSENEFHGKLSTELNRIFAPYLRTYSHVWEQFLDFYKRISNKIVFPDKCSLKLFVSKAFQSMVKVIEKSYEPKRLDSEILSLINQYQEITLENLQNPNSNFINHKNELVLTGLSSVEEIIEIVKYINSIITKRHETNSINTLNDFINELMNLL